MEAPEEAARLGRLMERKRPDLLRSDWGPETKVAVMRRALRAKFSTHAGPREMLLSTAAAAVAPAGGGGGGKGDSGAASFSPSTSSSLLPSTSSRAVAGRRPGRRLGLDLVENSPHDFFWGRGFDGTGQNQLGRLLEELREELRGRGE